MIWRLLGAPWRLLVASILLQLFQASEMHNDAFNMSFTVTPNGEVESKNSIQNQRQTQNHRGLGGELASRPEPKPEPKQNYNDDDKLGKVTGEELREALRAFSNDENF